jgi:hypothetical protein
MCLNPVANRRHCVFRTSRVYGLLFRAAADTLIMIVADPKAFTAILHTATI